MSRNDTLIVAGRPGVHLSEAIMSGKKIAVPDEIYERVQQIATAEGTTVEEFATKALERDLARRWTSTCWLSAASRGYRFNAWVSSSQPFRNGDELDREVIDNGG